MMKVASYLFVLILFSFSSIAYSQSFQEKPEVPVFYVEGKSVVRVDCWGIRTEVMESLYLERTKHPQVFNKEVRTYENDKVDLTVSLLDSENTLQITLASHQGTPEISVETYGLDSTLKLRNLNITCDIFTGELDDN